MSKLLEHRADLLAVQGIRWCLADGIAERAAWIDTLLVDDMTILDAAGTVLYRESLRLRRRGEDQG